MCCSSKLQLELIDVAPAPIFAGLKRSHDRMMSGVEMPGCVFILR